MKTDFPWHPDSLPTTAPTNAMDIAPGGEILCIDNETSCGDLLDQYNPCELMRDSKEDTVLPLETLSCATTSDTKH